MTPTRAYISIDYDEGERGSYRGVVVGHATRELKRWSSGDPQADWKELLRWLETGRPEGLSVGETSSITHFLQDVPGWRMIEDAAGREVLVPEDRPGFEDRNGVPIPLPDTPDL
ncbi:hypothetical protein OCH239_09745 [Roseivivax halodurans JCM 10272]|uniref:Uncharacterized protein n=1 Tax=Roseivivax halodurans JCM 10272 TaxID=1449350 RepID=X7EC89_9RHOB|nr:hypothetical protein [Roseivivax halodurans]ETX13552.1 hypothetical protein OCH239_09745 [Roseivivax halodurans JCM 10272]